MTNFVLKSKIFTIFKQKTENLGLKNQKWINFSTNFDRIDAFPSEKCGSFSAPTFVSMTGFSSAISRNGKLAVDYGRLNTSSCSVNNDIAAFDRTARHGEFFSIVKKKIHFHRGKMLLRSFKVHVWSWINPIFNRFWHCYRMIDVGRIN